MNYLGIEVLERRANAREVQPDISRRSISAIDPGIGLRAVSGRDAAPAMDRPFLWTCGSKAEVQALKIWFAARKGRLTPFWLPTGRQDLLLAQPTGPSDLGLSVSACGYTRHAYPQRARRHLAISLPSGTTAYRQVTAAQEVGPMETLTLSASLGEALNVGSWLSYLVLCRLASDDLDLQWITNEVAEAQLRFVEVPQEAP